MGQAPPIQRRTLRKQCREAQFNVTDGASVFEKVMYERFGIIPQRHHYYLSLFNRFDEDNSGKLSFPEAITFAESLGLGWTRKQISDVMTANDSDHDGEISFDEFLELMTVLEHYVVAKVQQLGGKIPPTPKGVKKLISAPRTDVWLVIKAKNQKVNGYLNINPSGWLVIEETPMKFAFVRSQNNFYLIRIGSGTYEGRWLDISTGNCVGAYMSQASWEYHGERLIKRSGTPGSHLAFQSSGPYVYCLNTDPLDIGLMVESA